MFESKNYSPTYIAFVTAIVTSIISSLIIFIVEKNIIAFTASFLLVFTGCFFVSKYFIETFVHRRIKLIYKFIHQTKASKREEFFQKNILPQQSLDEVSEDVLKWADDRKAEMEMLDRKSTRLNSSHVSESRMPSSA